MSSKIGQKVLLGTMMVSLWICCIACGGDSSTTTNVGQGGAHPSSGPAKNQMQEPTPTSSETPTALPPTPVSRYQGKRNPFSPLITLEKEQELIVPSAQPVKRDPQTTLEKIALDQLTLTAIFKSPRGDKALVEEAGGKGHIVEKGAFIGTRGGRIQSITKDRVIIVEKTVDPNGKVTTHKKELKLASRANDPS